MSKMRKVLKSATSWRKRHGEEGLNLKGLDEAFSKYDEAHQKVGELYAQLTVAKSQRKQQVKDLQTLLVAVKGGRKLALKAKAVSEKIEKAKKNPSEG